MRSCCGGCLLRCTITPLLVWFLQLQEIRWSVRIFSTNYSVFKGTLLKTNGLENTGCSIYYLLVLELVHFLSNSILIELQIFEFEHIASSSFFHFSSLKLEFGDEFSKILHESFENFKRYQIRVCHRRKLSGSSLIELEI